MLMCPKCGCNVKQEEKLKKEQLLLLRLKKIEEERKIAQKKLDKRNEEG